MNISTKQFSAHREYIKMTFQSYNHTGEFCRILQQCRWGLCSSGMLQHVTGQLVPNNSRHLSGLTKSHTNYPLKKCHTFPKNGEITTSAVSYINFQIMIHLNIFEIIIYCLSFRRNTFSLLETQCKFSAILNCKQLLDTNITHKSEKYFSFCTTQKK